MNSLILRTAARFLVPILAVFSLYLLVRGHNNPGGGFIGGLVLASALGLHTIAYSSRETRLILRATPTQLIAIGLLFALGTGVAAIAAGESFLRAGYQVIDLGLLEYGLSSTLAFDFGVYLVVTGVAAAFLFALVNDEEEPWKS